MRIQKLLLIFLVVGSGSSQAFSQAALSERDFPNSAATAARGQQEAARLAEAEAKAAARKKASEAAAKTTSENFFRAKNVEPVRTPVKVEATPKVAVAPTSASQDPLVEILRKKQMELDAQDRKGEIASPAAPANKPVVKEVRPSTLPPKISTPAPVSPNITGAPQGNTIQRRKVVSQPPVDSAAEQRLVEAMHKKQAELDAKEVIAAPVRPVPVVTKPVEVKSPTVAVTPSSKERENSEARIKRIEAEIKAKDDAIKKKNANKVAVSQPSPEKKKEVAKVAATKTDSKTTAPAAVPAIDPNSKQGRLAELLRKYKADEITPQDYHLSRAKIVAEP